VSGVPEHFQLAGAFGIPAGATAVTGTLAVAGSSSPGRVALTPASTPGAALTTCTLSLAAADTRATGVTAMLGPDGGFWAVYETDGAGATTQLVFDLSGYFTPDMTGSTFHRLGPLRLIDSRSGLGGSAPLSSDIPRSLKVVGLYGIPTGATAVTGTLTAANATSAGRVSLTPVSTSSAATPTSSLEFATTDPQDTTVTVPLGADGNLWATLETGRLGDTADVIFDLSGYFAADGTGLTPVPAYFQVEGPYDTTARDSHGVVMFKYPSPIGLQYNTVTIAHCAIWYFDRWHSGTDTAAQAASDRKGFFAQVNWLVANQQPDGRWLYTFPVGTMPLPWWSAMAEGLGMSALLRAYSVTGDSTYLATLDRARSTFGRTIADLGVDSTIVAAGRQLTVYQEYVPGYENNVLNGWVFSLVGLYECAIYLGDPICLHDLTAADRGLSAVRTLLPYYDSGSWSFYSLDTLSGTNRGPASSKGYQGLVVRQLRFLYSITGDPEMEQYADRFEADVDTTVNHSSPTPP
jgi:hypothetical protein